MPIRNKPRRWPQYVQAVAHEIDVGVQFHQRMMTTDEMMEQRGYVMLSSSITSTQTSEGLVLVAGVFVYEREK